LRSLPPRQPGGKAAGAVGRADRKSISSLTGRHYFYRGEAKRLRLFATTLSDQREREQLIDVAQQYEKLAELISLLQ